MTSLIHGYEYDIFISYRQKDNKYDGWVTEFVDNLKRELEATFKEEVSVYFDINPHDGLLETHDVDASLKEKLKCLIFVPVISRTYCDPKSFAWEHEFKAFVELASKDQFGLKVKLPNGNVASRVLPVRIHDLDTNDIQLCESVLGGVLRGVEFIYKEPGVNRSLTPKDKEKKNLNGTIYRNQINKVALATKEIILGLQTSRGVHVKDGVPQSELFGETDKEKKPDTKASHTEIKKRKAVSAFAILAILIIAAVFAYPRIFKRNSLEKQRSMDEKISIAVMPFKNLTNDPSWNVWQNGIQEILITSFSGSDEIRVRPKGNIDLLMNYNARNEYAALTPEIAGSVSGKLDADIFLYGNILKAGSKVRLDAKLMDTRTGDILKPFEIEGPFDDNLVVSLTDTLRNQITDFLLLSKLVNENPMYRTFQSDTKSAEAMKCLIYGHDAKYAGDNEAAIEWYNKAYTLDSNFVDARIHILLSGSMDELVKGIIELHRIKDQFSLNKQIWINTIYSSQFESIDEQIKWAKRTQQIEGESPGSYWVLGKSYHEAKQYDKSIAAFSTYLEMSQKWGLIDFSYYAALGAVYHEMGRYAEEKKLYRKAERDVPDKSQFTYGWLLGRQAILSLAEKDTIEANRYIKKLISFNKENSSSESAIQNGLAVLYDNAGIPDRAEKYYRKALSLDPENPELLNQFAEFLSRSNGNPAEFTDLMDKALKLAPNKWDYYNYLDTKGYGLFKLGKNQEALDVFQNSLNDSIYNKRYTIRSHYEEVKKAVAGQK